MTIFISRDEMNAEQALAFDLGHAAATEQAKQELSAAQAALKQERHLATENGQLARGIYDVAERYREALAYIANGDGASLHVQAARVALTESPPVEADQ